MNRIATAIAATAAFVTLGAGSISFSGWQTQRLALFSPVSFGFSGSSVSVSGDGAASIAFKTLGAGDADATRASWSWSVSQSVPPTDLARRGGDDRNLALYFAFFPEGADTSGSVRSLLQRPDGRVLVYTWGGSQGRGAFIPSPYLDGRGVTIVKRSAGTGSASESVDLAADYARAFGGSPGQLVAVALSADSDDTGSSIRAQLSNLAVN
ncbi:MAG: DUF3047 domain-containing protein [Paracoccaceae bacterium]